MLIGITGKAGSGKDTVADFFALQYEFEKAAFANHLKDVTALAFGIDKIHFHNQELKTKKHPIFGITPREMIQKVGTECFRRIFDDNFWVNHVDTLYKQALNKGTHFIVSDCRFENEVMWVRNNGGIILNVSNPKVDDIVLNNHSSELGVHKDLIDYTIDNDESIAILYTKLEELSKEIQEQYQEQW